MPGPADPFDLQRFVAAQDAGGVFQQALAELRRGRKQTHWMWFVFPQSAGLGRTSMAQRYAIGSLDEARAYLDHPVLGPRLVECCQVLLELDERDPEHVLGGIDAMKLRSSMTLFREAAPDQPLFVDVLAHYYDGEPDPRTLELLRS